MIGFRTKFLLLAFACLLLIQADAKLSFPMDIGISMAETSGVIKDVCSTATKDKLIKKLNAKANAVVARYTEQDSIEWGFMESDDLTNEDDGGRRLQYIPCPYEVCLVKFDHWLCLLWCGYRRMLVEHPTRGLRSLRSVAKLLELKKFEKALEMAAYKSIRSVLGEEKDEDEEEEDEEEEDIGISIACQLALYGLDVNATIVV